MLLANFVYDFMVNNCRSWWFYDKRNRPTRETNRGQADESHERQLQDHDRGYSRTDGANDQRPAFQQHFVL